MILDIKIAKALMQDSRFSIYNEALKPYKSFFFESVETFQNEMNEKLGDAVCEIPKDKIDSEVEIIDKFDSDREKRMDEFDHSVTMNTNQGIAGTMIHSINLMHDKIEEYVNAYENKSSSPSFVKDIIIDKENNERFLEEDFILEKTLPLFEKHVVNKMQNLQFDI